VVVAVEAVVVAVEEEAAVLSVPNLRTSITSSRFHCGRMASRRATRVAAILAGSIRGGVQQRGPLVETLSSTRPRLRHSHEAPSLRARRRAPAR
jgi:hypothetical protein